MGKYWDIIPPKKQSKVTRGPVTIIETPIEEILKKFSGAGSGTLEYVRSTSTCLHKACSSCHGTGRTPWGPCIHMLSCPCPECSPTFLCTTVGTGVFLERG